MATPFDLTTTAAVKSWQSLTTADQDTVIGGLITAASRSILGYLGRPFILPKVWTDRYDVRVGLRKVILRNWPVVSVSAVQIGATSIQAINPQVVTPPSPSQYPGFILDTDPWGGAPPGSPVGLSFVSDPTLFAVYCQQGLQVTYTAGYQDTDTFTVASGGGSQAASPLYGNWASDMGVVYAATGVALTAVSGAPATGQYTVDSSGNYTFAAGDQGLAVTANYGYVPMDLAQACIEVVAQRLVAGSRVGVKSKSLGGQETVSYDMSAMPDAVMKSLQPYKKVFTL